VTPASTLKPTTHAGEPDIGRVHRAENLVIRAATDAVVGASGRAPAMRILLVEDSTRGEENRSSDLVAILARHGGTTTRVCFNRLTLAAMAEADLILLESSAPGNDVIACCREIRTMSDIPLIVLADPSRDNDQVGVLRSGADDCLVKPYNVDELIARIQVILRRRGGVSPSSKATKVGDVTIDPGRMSVTADGRTIDLTKKEFQLLALIVGEQGGVCSRERLVAEVWGRPEKEVSESLHVLISRLRSKLGADRIKTVRSVGYRLVAPGEQG
jgi:DNA-binding response OmpR family regulator